MNAETVNPVFDMDGKKLKVLRFILKKILLQIKPKRIILFGSLARGDGKAGADIDLAIEPKGERLGFLDIIANADIVNLKDVPKTLKENILKEGRIIYEKGRILI